MFLDSLFAAWRGGSRRPRRQPASPRLTLEVLEGRAVPSALQETAWGHPSPPPSQSDHSHSQAVRPIEGHGQGGFTDAAGGFFATGIASHLGAFTHYGTLTLTPTDDPVIFHVSGSTTFEAANGDKLYANLDGTLNVQTGVASGTDVWAGGTGRFADASGQAHVTAQLGPNGSITFEFVGGIRY